MAGRDEHVSEGIQISGGEGSTETSEAHSLGERDVKDSTTSQDRKVRHDLKASVTSNGFSASQARWGLSRDPEGREKGKEMGRGARDSPLPLRISSKAPD